MCRRNWVLGDITVAVKNEKNTKQGRGKVQGIIIKRSVLNDRTWLVKYSNSSVLYYCHDTSIVFDSANGLSPTPLNDDEKKMLSDARFQQLSKDHEDLLKPILFPVIALVPDDHVVSIPSIVRKLRPQYP